MVTDSKFTKVNVTCDVARALKMVAAENEKFMYEIVNELARERYPSYFGRC